VVYGGLVRDLEVGLGTVATSNHPGLIKAEGGTDAWH
jgi:hypothetical protein